MKQVPPFDFPFQRIWKLPKQVRSSAPSAPAGTNCKSVRNQKGKNGKAKKDGEGFVAHTNEEMYSVYINLYIYIYTYITLL